MDADPGRQSPSLGSAERAQQGGADSAKAHADLARYFFGVFAQAARAEFDPLGQWEEFVEALWEQVDAGFALTAVEDDFPDVPRAWFDRPGTPPWTARDDAPG